MLEQTDLTDIRARLARSYCGPDDGGILWQIYQLKLDVDVLLSHIDGLEMIIGGRHVQTPPLETEAAAEPPAPVPAHARALPARRPHRWPRD